MSLISACALATTRYRSSVPFFKPLPLPPLSNQIFRIPAQWSNVDRDHTIKKISWDRPVYLLPIELQIMRIKVYLIDSSKENQQ